MPHNPITLLSRDDLDRWHAQQELERARTAYRADPTPANKAQYLLTYREALALALIEAGIGQPEVVIDEALASLDSRLNSNN